MDPPLARRCGIGLSGANESVSASLAVASVPTGASDDLASDEPAELYICRSSSVDGMWSSVCRREPDADSDGSVRTADAGD